MKPKRLWAYWKRHKDQKCQCLGYHFPHRKGGGACEHSNSRDYYMAIREGYSKIEALQFLTEDQLNHYFPGW